MGNKTVKLVNYLMCSFEWDEKESMIFYYSIDNNFFFTRCNSPVITLASKRGFDCYADFKFEY